MDYCCQICQSLKPRTPIEFLVRNKTSIPAAVYLLPLTSWRWSSGQSSVWLQHGWEQTCWLIRLVKGYRQIVQPVRQLKPFFTRPSWEWSHPGFPHFSTPDFLLPVGGCWISPLLTSTLQAQNYILWSNNSIINALQSLYKPHKPDHMYCTLQPYTSCALFPI